MRTQLLLAGVLALCVTQTVSAQVRKGLKEYNATAHVTAYSNEGESVSVVQLQGRLGIFLTRTVELGPSLALNKFEDVDTFGSLGGFAHFHFGSPGARSVPYVGAELAFALNDDECFPIVVTCGSAVGAVGGAKFFLGQNGAFVVEAFVTQLDFDDDEDDIFDDDDVTAFGIRLGMSLFK